MVSIYGPAEHWVLSFRRAINGWYLVAARKPGARRIYTYGRIPKHVRDWALADERGKLDAEAARIVNKKAGGKRGKHAVTIEAVDVTPKAVSRRALRSRALRSRIDPLTRVARQAARRGR